MDFSIGSLVLGMALGWGAEWCFDYLYMRRRLAQHQIDNDFKLELSAMRNRFEDAVAEKKELEGELQALRDQLSESLPPDSAELYEKLRAVSAENAALKIAAEQSSTDNSLAQELAEAKSMIERLQSENNTSPIIALNELQAKLDEAESELSGYRSVEEITKIEIQDLRNRLAEAEARASGNGKGKGGASTEEVNALKAELLAKDEEIRILRSAGGGSDDAELRTKASQADYFAKQLENARATIATLEQEMLKPVAPAAPAVDLESQKLVGELQEQLSRVNSSLEAKTEELQLLQAQLLERERSLQSMASFDELADARSRADAAEERLTNLMAERQNEILEMESLRSQLAQNGVQEEAASSLRQEIEDLSAKLASRDQAMSETRSEFNALNAKLHATLTELEDLRSARSARDNEVNTLRDELAAFKEAALERSELENKLKEAEIELEAYNDLKEAKNQLQDRVGMLEGELAETRAQAKQAELEAKTREAERAAAEVAQLKAHLEHHRKALEHALSQLDQVPFPSQTTNVETAAPQVATPTPTMAERDPLEKIQGIGFVYERKLWDAGILTFEDLANASVDEVTAAIAPEEWQQIDPASWIAAAKKILG